MNQGAPKSGICELAVATASTIRPDHRVGSVRRRLARWTDSSVTGRRLRRALIANPLSGRAIRALDRRRLRRLQRRGDPGERAKLRWRAASPDHGLTWGERVSGDAAAAAAAAHGAFGPGRTVLEVGPGYGRVLASCLARELEFGRYIGLDLSERNVEQLRAGFEDPRVEFHRGDAETAALGERPDAVISFLVFKHLYPSFEPALANLAPQLAPGATVLFDLIEGPRTYFHDDGVTYIREYSQDEARRIVERCGLSLTAFDAVEHAPGRERLLVVARKP
jgi:SAM-dependent methyltransferase